MRRLAFDFETHLIADGDQIPQAVCMGVTKIEGLAVGRTQLLTAPEGVELLRRELVTGSHFVGAETAFDVLVSCRAGGPDLLRLWRDALAADRVTDVLLRECLLDLAAAATKPKYSLDTVVHAYDPTFAIDKSNPWRLRFGELDGMRIVDYPESARDYATADPIATAIAWIGQEIRRTSDPEILRRFPGYDPLLNQYEQTRGALPLKGIGAVGLRADPDEVAAFGGTVRRKHGEARDVVIAANLINTRSSRNMPAIRAWIDVRPYAAAFYLKGKFSLSVGCFARALEEAPEVDRPTLQALRAWQSNAQYLATLGLVTITESLATKRARDLMLSTTPIDALVLTDAAKKRGAGFQTPADASLNGDACRKSKSPELIAYSQYTALAKLINYDLKIAERAAVGPLHARYNTLLVTGRTSTSPNVQNMPRMPGIRECYVPRPGYVFAEADYKAIELYTFAQICLWVVGWSKLAEHLNAGVDPHTAMAAEILGIGYAEAAARKKEWIVDNARTAGKGVNFGRKGGLGGGAFVDYAWNNYGIEITVQRAKELIALHDRLYPEMTLYTSWVESMRGPDGTRSIVQPWSGRLRGGCGFTDGHNSPFQGFASDIAKRAMWHVWQAQHGLSEYGDRDPLYGSRMVLFSHDSIASEVREDTAHEAAERLSEIMVREARALLPDLKPEAAPHLTRQLSKKAEAWRDAAGRLIPWDMREACRREAAKVPAGGDVVAILAASKWPAHVIREITA